MQDEWRSGRGAAVSSSGAVVPPIELAATDASDESSSDVRVSTGSIAVMSERKVAPQSSMSLLAQEAAVALSGVLASSAQASSGALNTGFLVGLIVFFGVAVGVVVACWPPSSPAPHDKLPDSQHPSEASSAQVLPQKEDPVMKLIESAGESTTERMVAKEADSNRLAQAHDRSEEWAKHEGRKLGSYTTIGGGSSLHHTALASESDLYRGDTSAPNPQADGERLSDLFVARGPQGLSISVQGEFRSEPQDGTAVLKLMSNNSEAGSLTMSEVTASPACGILVEATDFGARLQPLAFLDTYMAYHHGKHNRTLPFVIIHKTEVQKPTFSALETGDVSQMTALAGGAQPGIGDRGGLPAPPRVNSFGPLPTGGDSDPGGLGNDPLARRTLPVFATVHADLRSAGRFLVRRRTLDGPIIHIATFDASGIRIMDSYLRLVSRVDMVQGGFLLHVSQGVDAALMLCATLGIVKLGNHSGSTLR